MRIYWAFLQKDVRIELRTRQTIVATLVFAALLLVLFNFSFDLRAVDPLTLAPGILWVTFVFNGVLVLGHIFSSERENDAIEGITLAPIDRGVFFAAKSTFAALLMLVTDLAVLVVYGLLFNSSAISLPILISIVFATVGFATAGTAVAVVAFNSRAREIMLPILLLPLTVPLLVAAVRSTALVLAQSPFAQVVSWLNLMLAFDLLVGIVCYYVFGSLLEE